MSVTIQFGSLDADELRAVLLAHKAEYERTQQPRNVYAQYAQEHDRGLTGAIVRGEGPASFTVTTLPLTAQSATLICDALADHQMQRGPK